MGSREVKFFLIKTTMQPEGSLSEVEGVRRMIIRQVTSTSLSDLFI